MGNYYDWNKILSKKTDKELLDIYYGKTYPIQNKREIARKILIDRGILSVNDDFLRNPEAKITAPIILRFFNFIIDIFILKFFFSIISDILILNKIYLSIFYLIVLVIIVYILYYFILELTTQRSLAKFITGTLVVNEDNIDKQPNSKQIIIRTLARLIPFEPLSLGQWHDSLSKTLVIRKRDLEKLKKRNSEM